MLNNYTVVLTYHNANEDIKVWNVAAVSIKNAMEIARVTYPLHTPVAVFNGTMRPCWMP